jgi:putative aminopeptidase FrvX
MKDYNFLREYLHAKSPTGHEIEGQRVWSNYLKEFSNKVEIDEYCNGIAYVNQYNPNAKTIMLEAHADEIGWRVLNIDDKGFIWVSRNGGSDPEVALGTKVVIMTENGLIKGHFGWIAIHERDDDSPEVKVKNLFIDIECESKEDVINRGVRIGDPILYDVGHDIRNGKIIGRALDNRIGGYMIAMVAKKIHENGIELPFNLVLGNSAQEEIGLEGVKMVMDKVKPDVVLVTDVTHDSTTPYMKENECGYTKCGEGAVVFRGADIQVNLNKQVLKAAEENNIPYQLSTYNGNSGTDTAEVYTKNGGTPAQLISLPLKYMHTTVETVDASDVEECVNLIYHSVLSFIKNTDFKYEL